jgi:hypothetical protein
MKFFVLSFFMSRQINRKKLSRQGQKVNRNFAATKVTCGAVAVFQVIYGDPARDAQRNVGSNKHGKVHFARVVGSVSCH